MDWTRLADPFPAHVHPPRTPGVHLTDVLDFIEVTALGKPVYKETGNSHLFAEIGFLWETLIKERELGAGTDPDIYEGELLLDGVYGSPDALHLSKQIIYEFKCTWKSQAKTPVHENQRWLWQVKAYCKMSGFTQVVFKVLYINGSYRPFEPIYDTVYIKFTQEEIDANWNMIMANAKAGGFV